MRGCQGRRCLCASMEDNLMTVEGGSGCLKELSIPAALLRREVKAICPTSKTKDTHTFKPSVSGPANRWRRSTVPNLKLRNPHTMPWHSWQCISHTGEVPTEKNIKLKLHSKDLKDKKKLTMKNNKTIKLNTGFLIYISLAQYKAG